MAVDPREIEAMERLRRIMNGEQVEDSGSDHLPTAPISGGDVDATADMKRILEAFNKGSEAPLKKIKEEARENRQLRDALITEKTKDGVKMGAWEIKVFEEKGIKYYDVVSTTTGDPIARDLTLYETALSLTKLLNFHVGINSPKIREILDLEEKYSHYRQEAAMFKARSKQRYDAGDLERGAVAEDRFNEARDTALKYRQKLVEVNKNL